MHYVYIIKSINYDEIYNGVTKDLQRRFNEHNSGHTKHTSKFAPWILITYTAFKNENMALNFEKYLKTGSGIAFARKHLI